MANPWKEVTNARLTAGKYWYPNVNLDLMRNDHAVFERPFDCQLEAASHAPLTTSFSTATFFRVTCPIMGSDPAFPFQVRIGMRLEMYATGTGDPWVRIWGTGGNWNTTTYNEFQVTAGAYALQAELWANDPSSWLSGAFNVGVQARKDDLGDSPTLYVRRRWGTYGANCYIRVDE